MVHRHALTLWATAVAALALLGCRLPRLTGNGLDAVAQPTVPVSQEAAQRFIDKARSLGGQQFRVELTEQEITSYVALYLADQVPLKAPQIRLLPGRLLVQGDVDALLRVRISLTGHVKLAQGQPQIEFEQVTLGSVSLPRFLLGSLSDSVTELVDQSLGSVHLWQVEIRAGYVVISGSSGQP